MTDEIYSNNPQVPPLPPVEPTPEPWQPPTPTPEPVTPPPSPEPVATPYISSKPVKKSSVGGFLVGLLLVLIAAGAIGMGYYMLKLRAELNATPAPSPSVTPAPSIEPVSSPSATPAASKKPVATTKPLATPTSTPTPLTNFDIRFGNPSANVKQTYDDGSGAGRVINREFTSIQAGQFDELPASWNPRVTVCFHIVANEVVSGAQIKYSLQVNDAVVKEDTLAQYDKLEAGRLYDLCYDTNTGVGKNTLKLLLNGDKSVKEGNYVNDLGRLDYENLADNVAPNYIVTGPTHEGTNTCVALGSLSDNVTPVASLKIEKKLDAGAWETTTNTSACTTGTTGAEHTYTFKVSDARGNVNQQSKTFVLY